MRMLRSLVLAMGLAASLACGAQSLTIGLQATVNTLDPHMSGSVSTDLSIASHIYDSLVTRDADLQVKPQIALSWRNLDDDTWEFQLRPGVRFADGEALDSNAVRWNFMRVLDAKTNARIRPWFRSIDRVDAVSPTVLRVHTKVPFPSLLAQLTMFYLLPPKWAAAHHPANEALGTGPYELKQYVPGDRIVLSARKGYWGAQPKFQTVTFRILTEPATRTFALLSHEVDFVRSIPLEDLQRVDADRSLATGKLSASRATIIKFNTLKPPFYNNVKLRLALNYAVDKQTIHDTLLGGTGDVLACQVLTPSYFGYNAALKPIPYDPARARELLKESGFPKHGVIDLDVPAGSYFEDDEIAQAIVGQIEEVLGIGVRLHEMDFSLYMTKYLKANDMAPMAYIAQAWPSLDAEGILMLFAPNSPYAYWKDAPFASALEEGNRTLDPEKRKAAYARATQRMCEQAPALFLFAEPLTYGINRRVRWHARPDDWTRASDFTLTGAR